MAPTSAGVSRVPAEAVAAVRQQGLLGAHAVLQHALAGSTWQKQQAAAQELGSWLSVYGEGTKLTDCSPDDLLVYMVSHWLPEHPGRKRADGVCGPSALKSVLSSLSGFFSRTGRSGRYDEATGLGNPCDSVWVEDFRKAFERLSMVGGYVEHSAVPLTGDKYRQLVRYLWGTYRAARTSLGRLVILRDLLCAQYMWSSSQRGHDTGKLALADFVDPARPDTPFRGFPLLAPDLWPAGYIGPTLCVAERGTKTSRLQRAPPVLLAPNPGDPEFCFPRTLALYLHGPRRRPLRATRQHHHRPPVPASAPRPPRFPGGPPQQFRFGGPHAVAPNAVG